MADAINIGAFCDWGFAAAAGASNQSCDATNDGVGFIFQAETADPITHVGFRYGARTGTPPTYVATVETLATTGLPSGTDIGGGSPTAATFTPPADTTWDGLWQWIALTNSYTPAKGDMFCFTIRYSSGTVNGSNFSSFTFQNSNLRANSRALPAGFTLTAGTWSKQTTCPVFGYRTASGRYGIIWQSTYTTLSAATVGHGVGMHFTQPSGWGDTYKLKGVRGLIDFGGTGSTATLSLRNTSGTELASFSADSDTVSTALNTYGEYLFSSATALSYGTKYYILAIVVSAAVGMEGVTVADADDRSPSWPNGSNRGLVTYNGSTYTESNLTIPRLEIIIEDITEPAGGGGGLLVHPGMNGGLRG